MVISRLVVSLLAVCSGCAMNTAALTGKTAAGLSAELDVVSGAVQLCELDGLSKGLSPDEVCAGIRRQVETHEKALKLLAAYGKQLQVLAGAKGPEGKALADSVLDAVEPDGLDDYTDLIANASDAFVDMVARGWVRSEIRKNVDVHEKTILTVAAAELVFVREALADAEKIDEEVCTTLEHSKAELEALETSGALAEQRYGWPLGANLLRVEAHDRRRAAAQLEARLLSFMVATAYLARWARKTDGYADDVALLPVVKAAIECSTWTERGKPECVQHLEFLNARLQTLEIEPLARDPAATNDGTVMRRCVDVLHTEPTKA